MTDLHSIATRSRTIGVVHWLVLILFCVALATGYIAFDFDLKMRIVYRDALFAAHRLSGMGVAFTLIFWLAYRLLTLRRGVSRTVRERLTTIFHLGLALACIILPTLPWIGRALDGRYHELYLLWPAANLVSHPPIPATYTLLHFHKLMVDILLLALMVHILAALIHQFLFRDDLIRRMFLGSTKRGS